MKKNLVLFILLAAALSTQSVAQGKKTEDCYCTDKGGERVELGQTRCLNVGGRIFMARCEMSLNVPMWREQQGDCLSS
ncbi:MAG: hypothetical protein AAGA08_12690 [Pseudomonadota bacterium]